MTIIIPEYLILIYIERIYCIAYKYKNTTLYMKCVIYKYILYLYITKLYIIVIL